MKFFYIALFITMTLSFKSTAQVGIGTTNPDSSALLELSSSNSGFLLPRIVLTSNTDVTTIPSPAEGLMVYNLSSNCDLGPGIYIYSGTKWRRLDYGDSQTFPRLVRDEIGVGGVTFATINSTNSFGGFNSLFDGVDNTNAASFHVNRSGGVSGDWGFGITLPGPYFISSLILDGRNDCCTTRIENVVVKLYRCGNLVYTSPAITSASTGDNVITIPDIYASEIRLVVEGGGNTGGGSSIINFSELDIVASN